jgi:hypothetical protein
MVHDRPVVIIILTMINQHLHNSGTRKLSGVYSPSEVVHWYYIIMLLVAVEMNE